MREVLSALLPCAMKSKPYVCLLFPQRVSDVSVYAKDRTLPSTFLFRAYSSYTSSTTLDPSSFCRIIFLVSIPQSSVLLLSPNFTFEFEVEVDAEAATRTLRT